jgi:hypothetical protein
MENTRENTTEMDDNWGYLYNTMIPKPYVHVHTYIYIPYVNIYICTIGKLKKNKITNGWGIENHV